MASAVLPLLPVLPAAPLPAHPPIPTTAPSAAARLTNSRRGMSVWQYWS
jgi:hypothetical protein